MGNSPGDFVGVVVSDNLNLINPEFDVTTLKATDLSRVVFLQTSQIALLDFDQIWEGDGELNMAIDKRREGLL